MNEPLYRSRDDRVLAGVAGGLADHLGTDPTVVRLLWLLLVPLTGGLALLIYIVMAVIVPAEDEIVPLGGSWPSVPPPGPSPAPFGQTPPPVLPGAGWTAPPLTRAEWRAQRRAWRAAHRGRYGPGSGALIVGSILVLVGIWLLLRQYVPGFDPDQLWPFVLVGLGVVILVVATMRHPQATAGGEQTQLPPAPLGQGQPEGRTR